MLVTSYLFLSFQHWECKLLVTIFLYTVAASLMWIFMEGLYLHMLVYRTLFTERNGIRLYVLLGWGKFMHNHTRHKLMFNSEMLLYICT